jgi:hypothetical protein
MVILNIFFRDMRIIYKILNGNQLTMKKPASRKFCVLCVIQKKSSGSGLEN